MPHLRWPRCALSRFAKPREIECHAARALLDQPLDAEAIARKAMAIAADICVYTNQNLVIESLPSDR